MGVSFLTNESLYYSFDYDPLTRYRKWTRNYESPLVPMEIKFPARREVSLWFRLLRMLMGSLFFCGLYFLLVYATQWDDVQLDWPRRESWPIWMYWLRVCACYTLVVWPVILFFLSARRIMRPWVRSEIFRPPVVLHFNVSQSWLFAVLCIVWWHFVILSRDADWLRNAVHHFGEKWPIVHGVLHSWVTF